MVYLLYPRFIFDISVAETAVPASTTSRDLALAALADEERHLLSATVTLSQVPGGANGDASPNSVVALVVLLDIDLHMSYCHPVLLWGEVLSLRVFDSSLLAGGKESGLIPNRALATLPLCNAEITEVSLTATG
ncbi:hypothetical protein ColTof3_06772 [Colletotrichum tofieldiae]|nr:hypothetical protein ColTof3_06772 [Colletotrichum tofieldiae]